MVNHRQIGLAAIHEQEIEQTLIQRQNNNDIKMVEHLDNLMTHPRIRYQKEIDADYTKAEVQRLYQEQVEGKQLSADYTILTNNTDALRAQEEVEALKFDKKFIVLESYLLNDSSDNNPFLGKNNGWNNIKAVFQEMTDSNPGYAKSPKQKKKLHVSKQPKIFGMKNLNGHIDITDFMVEDPRKDFVMKKVVNGTEYRFFNDASMQIVKDGEVLEVNQKYSPINLGSLLANKHNYFNKLSSTGISRHDMRIQRSLGKPAYIDKVQQINAESVNQKGKSPQDYVVMDHIVSDVPRNQIPTGANKDVPQISYKLGDLAPGTVYLGNQQNKSGIMTAYATRELQKLTPVTQLVALNLMKSRLPR